MGDQDWDWKLGISDWALEIEDQRLGWEFGIEISDWELGSGLEIEIWDWVFGLYIWIGKFAN